MAERIYAIGAINLTRADLGELLDRGVLTASVTTDGDTKPLKVAEVYIFLPHDFDRSDLDGADGGASGEGELATVPKSSYLALREAVEGEVERLRERSLEKLKTARIYREAQQPDAAIIANIGAEDSIVAHRLQALLDRSKRDGDGVPARGRQEELANTRKPTSRAILDRSKEAGS